MSPSTERRGWLEGPRNSSPPLLLCLTKPSHRKPLCRLKRKIKGRTFFHAPLQTTRWCKGAAATRPNSSGEVQASGGPTNTDFSLGVYWAALSNNELSSIACHVFCSITNPLYLCFSPTSFIVCFRGRKSLTFEAIYSFSQPFGSFASSTVDKALTNHCRLLGVSFPVLALLEQSRGPWFKGENSYAIRRLILTSALRLLNVIILNTHADWSLSVLS